MNRKVYFQKKKWIYDSNDSGFHQRLLLLYLMFQVKNEFAKSLKKRSIYLNYYYYRFLFKLIRNKLLNSFYRNKLQIKEFNLFFPKPFLHKRMFFKNLDFYAHLDKFNSEQFWINGLFNANLKNNKYFYKYSSIPTKFGTHITFTNNIIFNVDDQKNFQISKKSFNVNVGLEINFFVLFNIYVFNSVEIYKICIYTYLQKLWK